MAVSDDCIYSGGPLMDPPWDVEAAFLGDLLAGEYDDQPDLVGYEKMEMDDDGTPDERNGDDAAPEGRGLGRGGQD